MVGQLGSGDGIAPNGRVGLAVTNQVVCKIATGALLQHPLQPLPEVELEAGGQALVIRGHLGCAHPHLANHVYIAVVGLAIVGIAPVVPLLEEGGIFGPFFA